MTQHVVSAPARPSSIALIDLSYLFKKRYHTVGNDTPMAAARATLRDIEDLKRGVGHVIICRDAPPYKRLEAFAEYKANRPEMEPEERAQRRWLFEEIKRLGFNVAWSEGHEADDVIATLAKEYSEWCDDVRIVGPDKDAAQCLTEQVTQYIPPIGNKDWEVRGVKQATEKFGVPPELMTFFQGLCGDKGDNIPGVRGIGEVKAAQIANTYKSVQALAEGLASKPHNLQPAVVKALAEGWDNLVLSVKLATLDTKVPVDSEALLVKREAQPEKPTQNEMDIELDGFVGNSTPMPAANESTPLPEPGTEESRKILREAVRVSQEEARAAKDAELLERESDRERAQNEEHDTVSNQPNEKRAERVAPAPQQALAKTAPRDPSRYGLVTADLQPTDLQAAYTMSEWLLKGGLFKQFTSTAQIFTVMLRGKELGLGVTTALAGFHIVEGKPTASADLIRALAERDPNFEYLMPIEISPTKVVWRGKHKKQPSPVDYAYTIEDAKLAGLVRAGNYGTQGNWGKRPVDMLMKTAGSKLARILWPAATMGCYCPEEMGFTAEELDAREAA